MVFKSQEINSQWKRDKKYAHNFEVGIFLTPCNNWIVIFIFYISHHIWWKRKEMLIKNPWIDKYAACLLILHLA